MLWSDSAKSTGQSNFYTVSPANRTAIFEKDWFLISCDTAYVPPYLCDVVAGSWYGYSIYSISAGAQFHFHDPNLYPCHGLSANCTFSRKASERQDVILTLNYQGRPPNTVACLT